MRPLLPTLPAWRSRAATLPLGIDIGTTRVRIALLEPSADGAALVAVAARERADDPSESLRDALAELGTHERRCVLSIAEPEGLIRSIVFPPMPARERALAAQYEADRFISREEPIVVRLFPLADPARFALGIARRSALVGRTTLAKQLGLQCVAIDNAAFAFERLAQPGDAILDIGELATTLYLFGDVLPGVQRFDTGGRRLTQALAESLAIDYATADRRKRALGLSGAASYTTGALIEALSAAIITARARGLQIERLLVAGNGARLRELLASIAAATAIKTIPLDRLPVACETLPANVVRAELPDWALAIALALRGAP